MKNAAAIATATTATITLPRSSAPLVTTKTKIQLLTHSGAVTTTTKLVNHATVYGKL